MTQEDKNTSRFGFWGTQSEHKWEFMNNVAVTESADE